MRADAILQGRTTAKKPQNRPNPADSVENPQLDEDQARLSASLMRVNHAGEVAAQALYQGQSLVARNPAIRKIMQESAVEEEDHLFWCRQRLDELHSHPSYLDPIWYAGSFSIGTLAGCLGDSWSLGFVVETEEQVMRHLDSHLSRLPAEDNRSRIILEQMQADEGRHAANARDSGARGLPRPVKKLMTLCSRVMTTTAFWV